MDDTGIYKAGTVIDGRYEIESRLGRGGFATVYRARHLQLDRPAALKVLEPVAPFISDRFYERFETEARIAANLDHPNVVRIFDYGMIEPDNRPYIAMEMLQGRDLEQHLELHGSMTPSRAKDLFEGVLDALRLGHERGIIHKDLKPSNLFMVAADTPSERLVVLDYGIARLEGDENPRYTEEGQYTGTPAYMPPEYIQNREVSPAFDVYQMGLIFIEAMTGQPAIVADSNLAYMVAHIEGKHRIPDGFGDSPLGATLLKAISTDPAARYQDAGEMLDAVRIARVDHGTDFTLPAITADELPRELQPSDGERPPPTDEKSSNAPIWIALAVLVMFAFGGIVVVGGGAAAWWYFSSEDAPPEVPPPANPKLSAPSPTDPPTPNQPEVRHPNLESGAQELVGLVLARYMVEAVFHQVELYEASMDRAKNKPGPGIFAPTGHRQMLDSAYQQIDQARGTHGSAVKKAKLMQKELRDVEVVLTDLQDYYSVKKGYKKDGGKKGLALHKRLKRELKDLRPRYHQFARAVSRALREFFDEQKKAYKGTDPFLRRATEAMRASQMVIERTVGGPKTNAARNSLEPLDESMRELQQFIRDHRKELTRRYSLTAGGHNRFLDALKDTYKSAHEIQSKAREGEDYEGDLIFLRMQLHSTLQTYVTLTQY